MKFTTKTITTLLATTTTTTKNCVLYLCFNQENRLKLLQSRKLLQSTISQLFNNEVNVTIICFNTTTTTQAIQQQLKLLQSSFTCLIQQSSNQQQNWNLQNATNNHHLFSDQGFQHSTTTVLTPSTFISLFLLFSLCSSTSKFVFLKNFSTAIWCSWTVPVHIYVNLHPSMRPIRFSYRKRA